MELSEFGIDIEQKKIDRLLKKIIIEEKLNTKSNKQSDAEMVKTIKKLIEEEIECY
jgi:hypothetical protein